MFINLTDVFTTEDKITENEVMLEWDAISYQGDVFPILEQKPVKLHFRNNGKGKAIIEGFVNFLIQMNCDRCLQDVKQSLKFSFTTEVVSPDCVESMQEEETEFMEGFQVNVEDLINHEILMNWPMKVLCTKDCKGICKVCGKNLNEGECECDTFVMDPRMAVIKDIFNANKEV